MPDALFKILKNGLLPLLLGCGLFFINIRPYHDWGGDFAQYLQQAHNLAEGRPLAYSTDVRNPDFVILGPEAYPPGFPLLLTISNALFEDEIIGGQYLVTAFLLLFGWASFLLFLRCGLPWVLSLMLMLTLLYHPSLLSHKSQVLSEFPFAFFFVLSILLLQAKGKGFRIFLMAGFCAGLAIAVRSAGWVLPLAGATMALYSLFTSGRYRFKGYLVYTLAAAAVAFFINSTTGFCGSTSGYSAAMGILGNNLWATSLEHLNSYAQNISDFIAVDPKGWRFPIILIQAFFWVGFIYALVKLNPSKFIVVSLLGYLLLLFLFPFNGGWRFLIPVIPLLLLTAVRGITLCFGPYSGYWAAGALLVLNISYQPLREYIISQQDRPQTGPQLPESRELFEFVKSNVSDEDLILFSKPRVLAYYTQKTVSGTLWELDPTAFEKQAQQLGANYFLEYSEINYEALNNYVEQENSALELVFHNSKFKFYRYLK